MINERMMGIAFIAISIVGVLVNVKLRQRKILGLKKSFLFPIYVFEGAIIAMASGDNDAINEWSEDQVKKLNRSKNYSPKKQEAWYFLAKEVLYNKVSTHFDAVLQLIEQKNYSHAIDVLVISNKEIMEYEVRK